MSLADNIKEMRRFKGLTQGELAKRCGIHRTTIANWEKGVSRPTEQDLARIAKGLDIEPTMFHVKPAHVSKKSLLPALDKDNMPDIDGDFGRVLGQFTGTLRIGGHAMYPKYPPGCIVLYKSADKDMIIPGADYVIDTSQGRLVRRLRPVEEGVKKERFIAYCYNLEYKDFEFSIRDVEAYLVLAKVEIEIMT